MEKIDQLIHAKYIITCEDDNAVLENHAIAIKDGKIHAIIPSKQSSALFHPANEQHFLSHALLPGFVNCHTHIPMAAFRGLADDMELMDWLKKYIWPAEGKWVSNEFVYDGSLIAMGEMIRCGTTCFNDMYFFLDATAKAAEISGMRAHIGMHIIEVPTAWASTAEEYFARALEFYEKYKNHPLVKPTMAPHSTYGLSLEYIVKAKEIADKYQLKMNIHLQEAPSEIAEAMQKHGKRPLQRLNEIGAVDKNLIAVHMTQINDDDMEIIQQKKPSIVHCPESNMKLVSGSCPVERLTQAGINVALGTDGVGSNNDLDMLGEMRSAAFLGKVTANDPKAVSAETVLKMATINGARALGIDHETGSLRAGKLADITAIDLSQLETQPLYHPVSQIVYAASRTQVTDVWIGGKQVLKNRELLTLDEKELLEKAKSWRNKLKN